MSTTTALSVPGKVGRIQTLYLSISRVPHLDTRKKLPSSQLGTRSYRASQNDASAFLSHALKYSVAPALTHARSQRLGPTIDQHTRRADSDHHSDATHGLRQERRSAFQHQHQQQQH